MSLNRLLYDHQIALMNAATAEHPAAPNGCINNHESLIEEARRQLGVAQYPFAKFKAAGSRSHYPMPD
ncbi:MAG: hypothetical protein AAF249_11540 [Pseudomonadota bacterium]